MITHFYSDPHFNHANLIGYEGRPYATVEEMNENFIFRYNREVCFDDRVVLWVGDVFFGRIDAARAIMKRLIGRKMLVRGNHDRSKNAMLSLGFDVVVDEMSIRVGDKTVRVHHYPPKGYIDGRFKGQDKYASRRPVMQKGEYLIHGHVHGKSRRVNRCIHVGVDAWDYRPASMGEVRKLIEEA